MEIELLIGHLKNKNIQSGLLQIKIRPGVLQFSFHKTNPLQECHDTKHCPLCFDFFPRFHVCFLHGACLLNAKMENSGSNLTF